MRSNEECEQVSIVSGPSLRMEMRMPSGMIPIMQPSQYYAMRMAIEQEKFERMMQYESLFDTTIERLVHCRVESEKQNPFETVRFDYDGY